MFGMNGFHLSASGAIQGHHGPLVFNFWWSQNGVLGNGLNDTLLGIMVYLLLPEHDSIAWAQKYVCWNEGDVTYNISQLPLMF